MLEHDKEESITEFANEHFKEQQKEIVNKQPENIKEFLD